MRLVALDIDGTTVNHEGVLSAAVLSAVQDTAAGPNHVVIATGRSVVSTLGVLRALGLETGFAVCSNGAVTIELDPDEPAGYRMVDVVTFDPGPALRILRERLPGVLVAVEELGVGFMLSAPFPEGELEGEHRIAPFEELIGSPATRVTLRDPDSSAQEFMAQVEGAGLHGVEYAVGWTAWLDLNPEGVSKASALELLRRRLGVEPDQTVAVGDMRNDIEMLRWAARGVAMGNAPDEVKAVADEVTGDVDDDGLVPVLRSLR